MLLESKIKEYLNTQEDISGKYSLKSENTFESGLSKITFDKWEFEQKEPVFTEEEITAALFEQEKENMCNKASTLCSDIIYKQYPLYKQIDIIGRINGYTDADFNVMNTFITAKLEECRTLKESINSCKTAEDIDNAVRT